MAQYRIDSSVSGSILLNAEGVALVDGELQFGAVSLDGEIHDPVAAFARNTWSYFGRVVTGNQGGIV